MQVSPSARRTGTKHGDMEVVVCYEGHPKSWINWISCVTLKTMKSSEKTEKKFDVLKNIVLFYYIL